MNNLETKTYVFSAKNHSPKKSRNDFTPKFDIDTQNDGFLRCFPVSCFKYGVILDISINIKFQRGMTVVTAFSGSSYDL